MKVNNKPDLAEVLGVTLDKLNYIMSCKGFKRPMNSGNKRRPCYNITLDYIKYFEEFVKSKPEITYDERFKKRLNNKSGRDFLKYLEARLED